VIISMQNGVCNADVLRKHAPDQIILGGIVGFGVLSRERGSFRRTTSGPLVIEASADAGARETARLLSTCGFEVEEVADLKPLQWSKLVMNLNNAVSALSGAPTKDILLSTGYRRILHAFISEALSVLRAAGIKPTRLGPLPVQWFPAMLRLPTPVLRVLSRAQLKVDPTARSSMWEDLEKRRPTEVDYLNGEIVRLAATCGAQAPINRRAVELIHEVEARGQGSPQLAADALWMRLHEA
jgi:2-dehydropantoate 2-reductase